MTEYPFHDELPAQGAWTGGKRYGYRVERTYLPRDWSDLDRNRAYALGITLPAMDLQTYETWFDQPFDVTTQLIAVTTSDDWLESTYGQRTVTAKRWSFTTWRYRTPWERRYASG